MKRLLNLFFCLSAVMMLSAPQFAAAQTAEVTVSGKVSDQNGLPIIGAGVVLSSDSSKGTTTDLDGNYTITVPANSTLNFSCIGYGDEAVSVNGRSRIDVVLSEDNEFIEETIVIGYGVQRKSDISRYLLLCHVQHPDGDSECIRRQPPSALLPDDLICREHRA